MPRFAIVDQHDRLADNLQLTSHRRPDQRYVASPYADTFQFFRAFMNKAQVQTLIVEKLQADLLIARDALQASHEAATHTESKAENKYDTRGLEAAYLADGQRRRMHEIETALSTFRNFPFKNHLDEAISLGALIKLDGDDGCRWVFLGPDAAGLQIVVDDAVVVLISPRSPLGRALLGLFEGENVELTVASRRQRFTIVAVL